jgi:hypothetical protein
MPLAPDSITFHDGYVEVVLQGISAGLHAHYKDVHEQVFAASLTHNCGLILLDASRVEYQPNVLLEHQTAVDLAARCARHPLNVRVAAVSPANASQANEHLETASRNRGANIKVFWNRDDAVMWLLTENS